MLFNEKQEDTEHLREYELVLVIDPEIEDEQFSATVDGWKWPRRWASTVDRVTQFVTSRSGELVDSNPWGKRKLAYPIKNRTEGNYIALHLRMEPIHTAELEASLELAEEVLRHLLVKKED